MGDAEHPTDNICDNRRMQGVNNVLPLSLIQHQPGLLQDIQMVGDARLADLKMLRHFACAHAFSFKSCNILRRVGSAKALKASFKIHFLL